MFTENFEVDFSYQVLPLGKYFHKILYRRIKYPTQLLKCKRSSFLKSKKLYCLFVGKKSASGRSYVCMYSKTRAFIFAAQSHVGMHKARYM
jgi:hypothetical protein